MTEFNAYFYGSKLFINGKKEYTLGEIFTKYLSKNSKNLRTLCTSANIMQTIFTTLKMNQRQKPATYFCRRQLFSLGKWTI